MTRKIHPALKWGCLLPLTLVFFLIIALVVYTLLDASHRRSDKNKRFQQFFQMPLPKGALGLVNEEPNPLNLGTSWLYSCFWLPPKEMERFLAQPPEGFKPWTEEFDLGGFTDRNFYSGMWPQAICSQNDPPHYFLFFVADPPRGLVHAVAWCH